MRIASDVNPCGFSEAITPRLTVQIERRAVAVGDDVDDQNSGTKPGIDMGGP